jgi:uncharacterized protein
MSVVTMRGGFCLLVGLSTALLGAEGDSVTKAAMRGDKAAVRAMLRAKVDVNGSDPDGTTALQWAARNDDLEMLDLLIQAEADPKVGNRYGVTPLYLASTHGDASMVATLLKAGVDPNSANPAGETALMTAARTGKTEAIEVLLDHGAAIDAKENVRGQTALMWAVLEDHADAVKLLVARKANINAQTSLSGKNGPTPISRPGQASGPGIYRQKSGPAVSGGMTPLLFAAREGNLKMAQLLLELGADVKQNSGNNTSPLVIAIVNNHLELALFLLNKGADPNATDSYGRAALFAAIDTRNLDHARYYPEPKPDELDSLLAHGANPNARASKTPIRGWQQLDASWVNFDGQTPFVRAALSGDVTVMRLLLEKGADPKIATDQGTTALMAAAGVNWVVAQTYSRSEREYLEAVQLCVDQGLDVNASNSNGFTAMHGAANRGSDAIIEYLALKGAKVDAKDKESRTPLTFAEGVFLAVNPPSTHPSTIALIKRLMGNQTTASSVNPQ